MKFSARYSLLFFCRIARFLLLNKCSRLDIFGHQALYTRTPAYWIDELPSRGRVGLNHSVKGVFNIRQCSSACKLYCKRTAGMNPHTGSTVGKSWLGRFENF